MTTSFVFSTISSVNREQYILRFKLLLVAFAVILILPATAKSKNLNSNTDNHTTEVVVLFVNKPKVVFPDRNEHAKYAIEQDKIKAEAARAEQARLEALRAAEAAKPTTALTPVATIAPASPDGFITALGNCESGNTANRNSGNGYYGAFQFSIATWNSMGTGYARADLAPYEVQVAAVKKLLSRSSVQSQFPGCSKKLGL